MPTQVETYTCSPSTKWEYRKVKIPGPPEPLAAQGRRSRLRVPLPFRNPRKMLTIGVSYRGGAEAWWQLEARGRVVRVPGHVCLHDALTLFQGDVHDGRD